jgi:hypothetical protein
MARRQAGTWQAIRWPPGTRGQKHARCARNATARPASSQASDLLRGSHSRVVVPVPPGARHAVVYSAAAVRDHTFLLHIPASVQALPIGNGGMIYLPVAARVQLVAASPTGTLRALLEARS